jgi:hypothetical protein
VRAIGFRHGAHCAIRPADAGSPACGPRWQARAHADPRRLSPQPAGRAGI